MNLLVPSLAVLIPILTLPSWLFYFDITPKVAVLLLGMAMACLLLGWGGRAAGVVLFVRSTAGRQVSILLAAQTLFLVIATLASDNHALSIGGSNWRMFGLVTQTALLGFTFLAAAALWRGEWRVTTLLRAMAITGSTISVYAILQYSGWDPLLPAATYHIGEGEWTIARPPGTVGHADYLGCYLVYAIFTGGALLWIETQLLWRAAGAFTIGAGAFAVILTGTRSAMLGLAIGVLLLLWRVRPAWHRIAAAGLLCVLLFSGFYISPWGAKLRGRARWISEDPTGGARPLLWRDSLRMAAERPLAGFGPETFSSEFPRFQSIELARAYPDFYHESAHNVLLDEIAAKGFAGALVLLLWCWLAGRAAVRSSGSGNQLRSALGAAWVAGVVCLQFNAFVVTTAFFFFLTSIVVLVEAPDPVRLPQTEPGSGTVQWKVLPVTLVPAAGFLVFALLLVLADVRLAGIRRFFEAGKVVETAAVFEKMRAVDPRPGASDFYYSRNMGALTSRQNGLLASVKAWQEGVQAGLRATEAAEDRQNAWYHLASLYAQVNNAKDAERCLRKAIGVAPNWFKPHWTLAQLLQASAGATRGDEAIAAAQAAVDRDGGKHAEVSATLARLRSRR